MTIVFEKRLTRSRRAMFLVPVLSLVLALVFGAMILLVFRVNPLEAYRVMVQGSLGSGYALSETLVKAIPLMLTGLGVAIAFRMLFWNIGAEGQLAMGGIAAAYIALFWADRLPGPLVLPTMFVAGVLAGAVWGLIPAFLRAALGVNEILTTLMMNYIAILLVEYLYLGPWRDPQGYGFPGTAQFPQVAWLPRLTGRVHVGLIFALVAAVLVWFVLNRTRWGYEIQVIGENPRAARYSGINIGFNILLVMLLSGGLSGLAGMAEVAGISRRLYQGLTVGYGYTAIIVAWLANLNPWGILLVAFLMGALLVGGDQLQVALGLPAAVALVLQGAILFFVLGGSIFVNYRVRIIRGHKEAKEA
ncbi:MAG TPA: ABC transporter permease [Thermoflexia bacterium]|jgi:simple sugar transport system permease protein|nr:ABC transporter permease [Thermoflexia bacterium]